VGIGHQSVQQQPDSVFGRTPQTETKKKTKKKKKSPQHNLHADDDLLLLPYKVPNVGICTRGRRPASLQALLIKPFFALHVLGCRASLQNPDRGKSLGRRKEGSQ
jgi:hypothetical protein